MTNTMTTTTSTTMPSSTLPTGAPTAAAAAIRNSAIADWASSIPPADPQPTYAPSNASAAANMAIAHWASSIQPVHPPSTSAVRPDIWALHKLSLAQRNLHRAQFHINAGHNSRNHSSAAGRNTPRRNRARNHGAAARHYLNEMVRRIEQAQEHLVDICYPHDEYIDRTLRLVLRDARESVQSTFGDFFVADMNYEDAQYMLGRVVARVKRGRRV